MTAKEYLSQVKCLDARIKVKISELNNLKSQLYSIPAAKIADEKVKSSTQNKGFDKVDESIDLEREIKQQIKDFTRLRHKIVNEIENLNNGDYINLLYKRYVEYKTFETIAIEMNYSHRHITRMHGIALKIFGDAYL